MIHKIRKIISFDWFFLILIFGIATLIYSFLFNISSLSLVGDAQRYNGYQAYIVRYSFLNFGQFGLWDQFLSSGMSWISHPGGGLLSPFAWISILITPDINRGSILIFYLNTFLVSFAYYFLCRVLGLHKITSFFVAILAISNQYIFTFVANGWFEEFFGLTIIPLTVGLLWLSVTKKNYRYVIIGGLAISLNFFANSYYVFHYNVMCLLWVGLVFIISELCDIYRKKKKNFKNLIHAMLANILLWVVFIGISAIKIVPLLEFRSISARQYLPLSIIETSDGVMTFDFFKSLFLNFIIPAGHTNFLTHWANDLGLFFFFLSIAYFLFKRNFKYGVFSILLLIGLWGYFAYRIPIDLYAFLYKFLPGFNSNNYPYRFIIIIYFAFLICIGLGLDLLIKMKNKFLSSLGIIMGIVMIVGASWYTYTSYKTIKYPNMKSMQQDMKNLNFKIEKSKGYSKPKIKGEVSPDLLADLAKIVKFYKPEGRVYSTLVRDGGLTQPIVLNQEIPSVHHSYNPIVPTYEYGIILPGKTSDSLELTQKRYKIFSVLNVRFHIHEKENLEYDGCPNLDIATVDNKIPTTGTCEFLENRLTRLIFTKEGGIYYDKDVLPKISLIPNPMLLITSNNFNDYSGFIAKQIMFHPDFNINAITILSGGSVFMDDYSINELSKFSAVVLIEPKIKDKNKVDRLLNQYKKNGGKIIALVGKKIHYESLHERSASFFTKNPAWIYKDKESEEISNILQTFKASDAGSIEIKKFTPEDLLFDIKTIRDNETLQFSDSFYPGWKATIDGKKTNIYMADGLVKAVVIPKKGEHLVRFYYDPDSFRNGAIISGVTVIILGVLFIFKVFKKNNL
jgi:hypothetical protein